MKTVKGRYTKKDLIKVSSLIFVLILLIGILTCVILKANLTKPKMNDAATSYISFNNSNATDMLKVSNLTKLSDEKGVGDKNKSTTSFTISGEKDTVYQIVLYHIGNMISEDYVHFRLKDKKVLEENILSEMTETDSGGRIIYEGIIDGEKDFELKMWVDKRYEKEIKNISYEIKLKSK